MVSQRHSPASRPKPGPSVTGGNATNTHCTPLRDRRLGEQCGCRAGVSLRIPQRDCHIARPWGLPCACSNSSEPRPRAPVLLTAGHHPTPPTDPGHSQEGPRSLPALLAGPQDAELRLGAPSLPALPPPKKSSGLRWEPASRTERTQQTHCDCKAAVLTWRPGCSTPYLHRYLLGPALPAARAQNDPSGTRIHGSLRTTLHRDQ